MKNWLLLPIMFASLLALSAACQSTPGEQEQPAEGGVVQAAVERADAPQLADAQVEAAVQASNAFAFDLYRQVAAGDENVVYSPYSISLAFSMAYAGARGETEAEMAEVFHFLSQEEQHSALNALDQHLTKLGENAAEVDDGEGASFQLNIANAVWAQEGLPLKEAYLETLAQDYGAGLRVADFAGDLDAALAAINAWTEKATEGRIEELAPPLNVTPETRLVLANAIFFKASWLFPFNEVGTTEGPFTLLGGTTVTAPLMHGTPRAPYAEGDDYQAVTLPYLGQRVDMVVIVPAEGEFQSVEERLGADLLSEIRRASAAHDVTLILPRFEFDTTLKLVDLLKAMDLEAPFAGGGADFSGMVESGGLFIADAVHKGTITVDEEGTEAAAVTGIAMEESAYPQAEVSADRPILFAIVERETGTVLFLGRVLNPAG